MLESSRYKWTLSDGVMTRAAFGNVNRYSKGEGRDCDDRILSNL